MIKCPRSYCNGFLYEDFVDPVTKRPTYTCVCCARNFSEKEMKKLLRQQNSTHSRVVTTTNWAVLPIDLVAILW